MSQLILRNIPEDLERTIRDYSQKKGQSINKTILDLLKKGFGLPIDENKLRDLSFIAGTWTQEELEAFEKNIDVFKQIDEDIWKK